MRRMYGLKDDTEFLPPMPVDGDTWSVMLSWALPTRSFLEFVMFSRCARFHRWVSLEISSIYQLRKMFSFILFES